MYMYMHHMNLCIHGINIVKLEAYSWSVLQHHIKLIMTHLQYSLHYICVRPQTETPTEHVGLQLNEQC